MPNIENKICFLSISRGWGSACIFNAKTKRKRPGVGGGWGGWRGLAIFGFPLIFAA